jgi:hypothetical protein
MYFVAGYGLDHEVAEVWDADEGRWRLVDANLDDEHVSPDGVRIDPFDVPRDQFLVAGAAWRQCRAGTADPETFVVDPGLDIEETRGWPQIRHDHVQDLAALNKTEMLLWDGWAPWGQILPEPLPDDDLSLLDRVADLTTAADPDVTVLRQVYEGDPTLRVPDIVTSADPLGGPPREVAWR